MAIQVQGAKTFQDLHPGLGPEARNHFYFRFDWIQQVVIDTTSTGRASRWTARTESGDAAGLLAVDASNARRVRLNRPSQPAWVEVSDGADTVRIWFVRAAIEVRGRDRVSARNPRWNNVQAYLTNVYGAQGHDFGKLGPVKFRVEHRETQTSGVRYGGMVEIVGTVEPLHLQRAIRIPVFLARRITAVNLRGRDAQGRPLLASRTGFSAATPGQNDTSLFRPRDAVRLGVYTGELTGNGQLFDYDMPGAVITSDNWPGDIHEYNVDFEQVVWIGTCSAQDPWPDIQSRGLAVSPLTRWSVRLRAEVVSTATDRGGLQVNVTGTAG